MGNVQAFTLHGEALSSPVRSQVFKLDGEVLVGPSRVAVASLRVETLAQTPTAVIVSTLHGDTLTAPVNSVSAYTLHGEVLNAAYYIAVANLVGEVFLGNAQGPTVTGVTADTAVTAHPGIVGLAARADVAVTAYPGTPSVPPVSVTGVTASVTADSPVGSVVNTEKSVVGVTLPVAVYASAGSGTVAAVGVWGYGSTAMSNIRANAGAGAVGTFVAGDFWGAPIAMTGTTGSVVVNLAGATVDAEDQAMADWDDATRTLWLQHTSRVSGTISVTADMPTNGGGIEWWSGATAAEMTYQDSVWGSQIPGGLTFVWSGSGQDYIRLTAYSNNAPPADLRVSWTFTPLVPQFTMTMAETVFERPRNLQPSCLNAAPGEWVTFTIVGYPGETYMQANSSGVVTGVRVPVLSTIPAGSHTLRAETASAEATIGFQILYNSPPRPDPPAADAPPEEVVQTGVTRWVFQDLVTGGLGSYVVPMNPESMTSPHAPPSPITPQWTTAPDGQGILWEGSGRAYEWTFSGTCLTEEHYNKLVAYHQLERKFYVIDHRNRAWIVTWEALNFTHKYVSGFPYAHTYEVTALVYGGPVTP